MSLREGELRRPGAGLVGPDSHESSAPAWAGARPPRYALGLARGVAGLVFLQILTGGMVAGLHAGFAYNTFPLMNGHWIPPEIFLIEPWYLNFLGNMATVQWVHRALAATVAAATLVLWWRVLRWSMHTAAGSFRARAAANVPVSRRAPHALAARVPADRAAANVLLGALVVQVGLGIATLLSVVALPLAALHQAGAVLLLAAALRLVHVLGRYTPPNFPQATLLDSPGTAAA